MKPRVGIIITAAGRARYYFPEDVERLERVADVAWLELDGPDRVFGPPADDPALAERTLEFVRDLDALVVSYGSVRITDEIMAAAPRLKFIGDTHGDRFGFRIDVAAAARRGIVVSDTTNGSSDPVAEWALALAMIGLRNAGALFRRILEGELLWPDRTVFLDDPGYLTGELTGKTVGLIAVGNIGRRLLELLAPFHVKVLAADPGAPDVLANIYDLDLTSLDNVMSRSDVVISLVPQTTATTGLIGEHEIGLLKPGAVFVNVSRGAIVDTDALIRRLQKNDIIACLDVVEPEPLAVDSPLRTLPNVFLTPHIAGVTDAAEPRFFRYMVDEVARVLDGNRPRFRLVPREAE